VQTHGARGTLPQACQAGKDLAITRSVANLQKIPHRTSAHHWSETQLWEAKGYSGVLSAIRKQPPQKTREPLESNTLFEPVVILAPLLGVTRQDVAREVGPCVPRWRLCAVPRSPLPWPSDICPAVCLPASADQTPRAPIFRWDAVP
jgi:hypothetical protein